MACSITICTILKSFSLPLAALIWAVYSWHRDNKRVLSIRQVGDSFSDRIAAAPDSLTTFSIEVAITNDSPRANIVIAYYELVLPWKTMISTSYSTLTTSTRPQSFTRYIPNQFMYRETVS